MSFPLRLFSFLPSALGLAGALALAGCTSLRPEQAVAPVQALSQQQWQADLPWQRTDQERDAAARRTHALLAQPVDAQAAVQLALLNHRGLQASLYGLGMAEADRVQALLWPNPVLSLGRLVRGDEREIERGLSFNLAALLGRGARQQAASQALARQQAEAAQQLLAIAAQARRSWIVAVASQAQLRHAQTVLDSAQAGAELASRMHKAGNISALRLARERTVQADASLALDQAQLQAARDRVALQRALGLWGDQAAALRLPEQLPDLPAQPRDRQDLEQQAMAERLDIQSARRQTALLAAELGLTRQTRLINVLTLGYESNRSNTQATEHGPSLSLELPLFDWGQARTARARQSYEQALERTAQVALDARAEIRDAQLRADQAWRAARRYRDDVLPLARQISDETLLRYNGMLVGVTDLLADARDQARVMAASLSAERDFWLAEADLSQSLLGPLEGGTSTPTTEPTAGPASPSVRSSSTGH
ncbi:Outer membrane protein TolC [Roseateles sp. YR242]|uniref:TolC family protein n=1 Tax=Roseateles sp. YR242 TaxID=1855305 RepID=UPI0008C4CA28|nr:TolC family protein [Roseateles sp. YR242]SEL73621.1 Outer membrane protein TolC [Roseateles sp. YR242]